MTEADCNNLDQTLEQLDELAPDVPLLALGQTVFWDEPMKAGVALKLRRKGSSRKFVAAVHDTDYFAKLPSGRGHKGGFKTFPHNDTTTRGLWSAAGEFSALFGSETVVSRDILAAAGLRVERLARQRAGFLDEATEAWGWRGIVSLDDKPPVSAELPLPSLFAELERAFDWAAQTSMACLSTLGRQAAEEAIDQIRGAMCDLREDRSLTLSSFYQKLLPTMYNAAANAEVPLEVSSTTQLLRFNASTASQPRFELVSLFVNPETRNIAKDCYDRAIKGSPGLYGMSRFGAGAIPFDLVVPGQGRGTVRLGSRGAVIMTPEPQFLSYKKPPKSAAELAGMVEAKFGPNCTLVGKAVTLIGMLAREFVFVFHEGASSYVKYSRKFHNLLGEKLGFQAALHPILRVRYSAWDSLKVCCSWLKLPEPMCQPFGTEELCAPSFADRWREVGAGQEELLAELAGHRRPIDLIRRLDQTVGGHWHKLAEEYEAVHASLGDLERKLAEMAQERDRLIAHIRGLTKTRITAEITKGNHFREFIRERDAEPEQLAERSRLSYEVERIIGELADTRKQLHRLRRQQYALTSSTEVRGVHERRQAIELEAELKRARLIRNAVISSRGLAQANVRPSAWWFPLVCPDGLWFRATIDSAATYLEPLRG